MKVITEEIREVTKKQYDSLPDSKEKQVIRTKEVKRTVTVSADEDGHCSLQCPFLSKPFNIPYFACGLYQTHLSHNDKVIFQTSSCKSGSSNG